MSTRHALAWSAILTTTGVLAIAALAGQARQAALDAGLWPRLQSLRETPAAQFKYLPGLPIAAPPVGLTGAHTAVAQALLYLDSQYGFIAPRHQRRATPDAELAAEVASLRTALAGLKATYSKDAVVAGLLAMSDANEKQYSRFLRTVPESSETGYMAHLVAQNMPVGGPGTAASAATGIGNLAKKFSYQASVQQLTAPTFEAIADGLSKGAVTVLIGDSADTWSTVAGSFLEEGTQYVIVHEPRFAKPQRTTEDLLGSLSPAAAPDGVRVYVAGQWPYKSAITVGRPRPDPTAFAALLKRLASPTADRGRS